MGIAALPAIETEKQNYMDLTHQLNNYNEIYNLNSHLSAMGNEDNVRLMATNETLKSQVLRMKQMYLLEERRQLLNTVYHNILYLTMVVFGLGAILTAVTLKGSLPTKVFYIMLGILVAIYFLWIVSMVRRVAQRRVLNINQYYWQGPSA